MTVRQNRRSFFKMAGLGIILPLIGSWSSKTEDSHLSRTDGKVKFKLALASYTLREFSLEQTLAMTNRVGLHHISLKSFHLPLDSTSEMIAAEVKRIKDADLNLYGCGVIYMKTEKDVENAFAYAKQAGTKVIIGVPEPQLLTVVDKKVKEYDISLAIHKPGILPTPQ